MPNRDISFKAILNTTQMEQAARKLQNLFTRQKLTVDDGGSLRKISTGADQATKDIKELSDAARRAETDIGRLGSSGGRLGGLGAGLQSALIGGAAGFLTVQGVRQIAEQSAAISNMAAESRRAETALIALAGGEREAAAAAQSVQAASGGTVTQLEAQRIATQALSLELAKTPDQFDKLVRAARVTALISPVIHDVASAISEIGLAAANLSYRRLDQLGISVTEVKSRMKELQAANSELTESQAFLTAAQDALIAKGGALINSQAAQATGVEQAAVAWGNLYEQLALVASLPIDRLAEIAAIVFRDANVRIGGGDLLDLRDSLLAQAEDTRVNNAQLFGNTFGAEDNVRSLREAAQAMGRLNELQQQGIQFADGFAQKLEELARAINASGGATEEQRAALDSARGALELYANGGIQVAQANEDAAASGQTLTYSLETVATATDGAGAGMTAMANIAYSAALAMDNASISASGLSAEMARLGQLKATIEAATAPINAAAARGRSQAISAGTNIASIVGPGVAQQLTEAAVGALEAGFDQLKAPLLSGTGTAPNEIELAFATQQIVDEALGGINTIRANEDARLAAEKKAQQDAERSAKQVASAQEKAAKDQVRILEQGLRSVPGLFGTTQVTQEDFALEKLGLRSETADEYIRRLRDEVKNGVDYADVSLEQAQQALERVGANIGDGSAEAIITALEKAWRDSSLFSDPQNIADLVNTDAVQAGLDQARKASEGQKNLLKFFGISDVEAAAAGIGTSTAGVIKDEIVAANIGGAITESIGGAGGAAPDVTGAASAAANVAITPAFNFDLSAVDLSAFSGLSDKIAEAITVGPEALNTKGALMASEVALGFLTYASTTGDTINYTSAFLTAIEQDAKAAGFDFAEKGRIAGSSFADGIWQYPLTSEGGEKNWTQYYLSGIDENIGIKTEDIKALGAKMGNLVWSGFYFWPDNQEDSTSGYIERYQSKIGEDVVANAGALSGIGGAMAFAMVNGFQNYFGTDEGKTVDLVAPIVGRLYVNVSAEANKKGAASAGQELMKSFQAGWIDGATKAEWISEIVDTIASQAMDAVAGAAEEATSGQ